MRRRNPFLPENPDVLDMLCRQAAITCEGMTALVGWANAVPDSAQRVRDLEHQADDAKRELRLALTSAFITPIDAEDIYVMSERLDAVLNGAKDTVRESEVMGIPPDDAVAAMAELLAEGSSHLASAFERLDRHGKAGGSATEAADAAVKSQRRLERVYREAASALLKLDDLREVVGRRELYRRFSRVSETLIEAADRVWYATVKEG
ncbi:MAG TPA: DUF47 family protein [Actinomycetota bacterium]|jgi:uncharacterized protein Yka (UPF0111/DUF47 family)|nr:DUF47 family protein [Actinomycetota bacterium]